MKTNLSLVGDAKSLGGEAFAGFLEERRVRCPVRFVKSILQRFGEQLGRAARQCGAEERGALGTGGVSLWCAAQGGEQSHASRTCDLT